MPRPFALLLLLLPPAAHAQTAPYPVAPGPGARPYPALASPQSPPRVNPFQTRPPRHDPPPPWGHAAPRAIKAPGGQPGKPDPVAFPSGPDVDASVAIQAAVDAAPASGWVVKVPQSAAAYSMGNPVYLDGNNVEIRGDGRGTQLISGFGGYQGPVVVLGVCRLEKMGMDPARYRMASVLDPARKGITTRGEAVLTVAAHPVQVGPGWPPDYWAGPAGHTIEFTVGPSEGAAWKAGDILFGLTDQNGRACPWFVSVGDPDPDGTPTLRYSCRTADQGERDYRIAQWPCPGGWPQTVRIDVSPAAGAVTAWAGPAGKGETRQAMGGGSTDGTRWAPGVTLARHDGVQPFMFGGLQASPTPIEVHGFIVHAGHVYDPSKAAPTRLDGQAVPASWAFNPIRTGLVQTLAWLPGIDTPKTHVRIGSYGDDGIGFWVRRNGSAPASNLGLRDLVAVSKLQQAVAVGYSFSVTMTDVHAGGGGLQGVGSVPIGCSYPVVLSRCQLEGVDCAYFGWRQILSGRDTYVSLSGRDGLRSAGGIFDWDETTFTFSAFNNTDCYFRQAGDGYGGRFKARGVMIDNEDGSVPRVACIQVEQSSDCPNQVLVDDASMASEGAGPFVQLIGHTTAVGNSYTPGRVSVTNIDVFAGTTRPGLQVVGNRGSWYGDYDARGTGTMPAGNVENINVVSPVTPVAAP